LKFLVGFDATTIPPLTGLLGRLKKRWDGVGRGILLAVAPRSARPVPKTLKLVPHSFPK
jgi:hypothetical protein